MEKKEIRHHYSCHIFLVTRPARTQKLRRMSLRRLYEAQKHKCQESGMPEVPLAGAGWHTGCSSFLITKAPIKQISLLTFTPLGSLLPGMDNSDSFSAPCWTIFILSEHHRTKGQSIIANIRHDLRCLMIWPSSSLSLPLSLILSLSSPSVSHTHIHTHSPRESD